MIPKIQERAIDIMKALIRVIRFIKLFVLRLLENKKPIPRFDQEFDQDSNSSVWTPFARYDQERVPY